MSNKYYSKRGQYLVVIDSSGNRLVEVILKNNKCRQQFDRDLVLLYDVPMEVINNVQIYLDGVRIR
ncbi:hypothetical protein [Aeromonas phage 4L372XY]|uniref:Uncharacterized protein n=1 Tax=Aeromonas phage 4L372XY TaxID=2588520 RepID=A0A5B9N4P8_9CAUD|nr:hypothetical protein HWC28_gp179 [Aeromonas phage 4L372XY]QEG08894.1 hypothetical protein [Aeromonas phage 4L372XY]